MKIALIILGIILGVFALLALAALPVYFRVFYNKKSRDITREVLRGPDYDRFHDEMLSTIDNALKIPFEGVYARAYDGKKLFGRVYLRRPGAPFHIQFNGYKGNGIRDFSGGLQPALGEGGNVLLVDQRSHGLSEGRTISFGVKERRDVLTWVRYVTDRFGAETPVYLEGVSMGAATVLMAGDLALPACVRGIIADCPYSSPFGIVSSVGRKMVGRLIVPAYPLIFLAALLYGRFNIFSSTALRSAGSIRVPVLLIHGTADNFVPVAMSRAIYARNPSMITFVEVNGAPHGLSYFQDHELYCRAFRDFLARTA